MTKNIKKIEIFIKFAKTLLINSEKNSKYCNCVINKYYSINDKIKAIDNNKKFLIFES